MKSIKPEEFFQKVAINAEGIDLDTARRVFYGMIRTITRELREKHTVVLPDFGEFVIHIHNARNIRDIRGGQIKKLPPLPTVKFRPDVKVKKYFYELGKQGL